jgi:hypothetical protein
LEKSFDYVTTCVVYIISRRGHRGHDRMVVGFTTTYAITTKVVSSNPVYEEVYSITKILERK